MNQLDFTSLRKAIATRAKARKVFSGLRRFLRDAQELHARLDKAAI